MALIVHQGFLIDFHCSINIVKATPFYRYVLTNVSRKFEQKYSIVTLIKISRAIVTEAIVSWKLHMLQFHADQNMLLNTYYLFLIKHKKYMNS